MRGAIELAGVDQGAEHRAVTVDGEHTIGIIGRERPIVDRPIGGVNEIDFAGGAARDVDDRFLEAASGEAVQIDVANLGGGAGLEHDRGVGGAATAIGDDGGVGEVRFVEDVVLVDRKINRATIIDIGRVGNGPVIRVGEARDAADRDELDRFVERLFDVDLVDVDGQVAECVEAVVGFILTKDGQVDTGTFKGAQAVDAFIDAAS